VTLSYTYDLIMDNHNSRTIQGFSTDSSDIFIKCQRCPLATHQKFVNYYGDFSYADDFIQAALNGAETNFENGNADFTNVSLLGRGGESYVISLLRLRIIAFGTQPSHTL
jgi:hypothetical protein